jgi:hypothetical protein
LIRQASASKLPATRSRAVAEDDVATGFTYVARLVMDKHNRANLAVIAGGFLVPVQVSKLVSPKLLHVGVEKILPPQRVFFQLVKPFLL